MDFSLREWKRIQTNVAEEYCWVITQGLNFHAAVDQFPVCLSLRFHWISMYIHTWLTKRTLNSDLWKIILQPDLPEHNNFVKAKCVWTAQSDFFYPSSPSQVSDTVLVVSYSLILWDFPLKQIFILYHPSNVLLYRLHSSLDSIKINVLSSKWNWIKC
jgi:hypothetical protein